MSSTDSQHRKALTWLSLGLPLVVGFSWGVWKLVEVNLPGSVSSTVVDQSLLSIDVNTGEHATLSPESKRQLDDADRKLEAIDAWLGQEGANQ